MKKYGVLFIFFFISLQCFYAQKALTGKLLDVDTGQPVDYANIGIVDQAKGTVSAEDGTFELQLEDSDINESNIIQFSRIGYETLRFTTKVLYNRLQENPNINLKEALFELEGVTLNVKNAEKNRVGYISNDKDNFAFWNDSLALGGEHASKIRIKDAPLKLEDMSFNVIGSISDSILVRVNIYEIGQGGLPGKNISNHNILHTITTRRGRVTIDLSPYNIVVNDHFIASLELLKIYGGRVGILISSSSDGYRSYSRLISQDRWKRIRKGTTIAFSLNTSQLEDYQFNTVVASQNKLREKPERITLLWDTSYSMKDKNPEKELAFLDHYFEYLNNVEVELQLFGYALTQEQFTIENGNWESLKKHLQEIQYDGANQGKILHALNPGEHALLFTDGIGFPDNIDETWASTIFTVNSQTDAHHSLLKSIAEGSEANYINLDKISDTRLAVEYTQKYIVDNLEYASPQSNVNPLREIKGKVTDFDDPIPYVNVKVRETGRSTNTDIEGNFTIFAKDGDILEFTAPGRESAESVVNANTSRLNITMPIGVKVLDEVVLEEYRNTKFIKGADPSKTDISTNFGAIDLERTGFAVRQIQQDQIGYGALDITEAIKGKFPGVQVYGSGTNAVVMLRVGSRFPAAWEVDGMLYKSENPPVHISLQNIKSITVMPGSWAAARYGLIARGGIIMIRTISQSFATESSENVSKWDALQSQDMYGNDAVLLVKTQGNQPKYIQWISGAATLSEAYELYLEQRKLYGHLPHFYADVHTFILEEWGSLELATKILSNLEEVFPEDISTLRLLAFQLEENGAFEEAHSIYAKIHNLEPAQAQSQRDLAHSFVTLGKIKEGWSLYKKYVLSTSGELDKDGIDKIIRNEALALANHHSSEIALNPPFDSIQDEVNDMDILVEWNNPNTEFELQFVGPTGHYFTWKHTKADNPSLLSDEIFKGYSSNSFQINNLDQGEWLLNVKYKGNQSNTPSFLKTTIKNNLNGTETIKVLRLQQKNVNFQFLKLTSDKISNFK
ncbi:carboxypeptidase-like regulatory domain-containing protein [Muricauda sp. ANG21]|uniref:carboxypeptidase-like regulatory domain-containing protein n=1 Tax=Allomuricauda sp. ANG21 TaxID=3042468 RepID=UPI0034524E4B